MPATIPDSLPPGRRGGWITSVGLGLSLLALYLANGREIGSYDTEATALLPRAILRGDGVHLDHFALLLREPDGRPPTTSPATAAISSRAIPVGPALLALPIVAVESSVLDRLRPGWDQPLLSRMGLRQTPVSARLRPHRRAGWRRPLPAPPPDRPRPRGPHRDTRRIPRFRPLGRCQSGPLAARPRSPGPDDRLAPARGPRPFPPPLPARRPGQRLPRRLPRHRPCLRRPHRRLGGPSPPPSAPLSSSPSPS